MPTMTQTIIQLGSCHIEPVEKAAATLIAAADHSQRMVAATSLPNAPLVYRPVQATLVELISRLSSGQLSSIRLLLGSGDVVWLLLYAPLFAGSSNNWWDLSAEYQGSHVLQLFDELRRIKRLDFVAVTQEETLDLDQMVLVRSAQFPWSDQNLIVASVRTGDASDSDTDFEVRKGMAYESL